MTEIIDNRSIVYQSEDGALKLPMTASQDSLWLCLSDIAKLFGVDKKTIQIQIQTILREENFQIDQVRRKLNHTSSNEDIHLINHYNLDVILSVGYKLSSHRAIEFRKWANTTLKSYISSGFVLNARSLTQNADKLSEVQKNIQFILKNTKEEYLNSDINNTFLDLIKEYNDTFLPPDNLPSSQTAEKRLKSPTLGNYLRAIVILKQDLISQGEASNLFGQQYEEKFSKIIYTIDERFNGNEVHSTLAQKASLLFYLIIKQRPFADGNKRIASFLLLYLLDHNDNLFKPSGEQKISDSSLYALSIMISNSTADDKPTILGLIKKILS
jgi:prophage maintenance system killer protein/prophage antirepressor-like protein